MERELCLPWIASSERHEPKCMHEILTTSIRSPRSDEAPEEFARGVARANRNTGERESSMFGALRAFIRFICTQSNRVPNRYEGITCSVSRNFSDFREELAGGRKLEGP